MGDSRAGLHADDSDPGQRKKSKMQEKNYMIREDQSPRGIRCKERQGGFVKQVTSFKS